MEVEASCSALRAVESSAGIVGVAGPTVGDEAVVGLVFDDSINHQVMFLFN